MNATRTIAKHPDQPVDKDADKKRYTTTTQGMSGHFAVMLWWNPDMDGFWEPWDTGIGRFGTKAEAEAEGREWAEAEDLEFRESMK